MRAHSAVNTTLGVAVLCGMLIACDSKPREPVDEMKSLIPFIEQRLNRRDLGGLKAMGTENFESNSLVIDVFGEHVRDSVCLSLSRIQQDGTDAALILNMSSTERPGEKRELHLDLKGDGKWKIDAFEITDPDTEIDVP